MREACVLYLLLTMAICLLLPWLPVLLLRLEPLRPPPPLSPEEMERLRAQLFAKVPPASARTQPATSGRQDIVLPRKRPHDPSTKEAGAASPQTVEGAPPAQEGNPWGHLTLRSYQWVNAIVTPLFILSMLGLAVVWALVFHYLGEARARSFPPGVFVFKPAVYWAVFGVPAIFLGIFSSIGVMEVLTRILVGRRYTEYSHWAQARLGQVRQQRLGRRFFLLAWLVGIGMAIWVLLAMNWYVRLTDDEIAIKPLFGIKEKIYPYNRVQQIVLTSHSWVQNEAIPGEGLHLRFDDGQTWSTGQTFRVPDIPEERDRLLELLSRKSGKPITRAKLIEQVPGW
jgi:hypothetical protein